MSVCVCGGVYEICDMWYIFCVLRIKSSLGLTLHGICRVWFRIFPAQSFTDYLLKLCENSTLTQSGSVIGSERFKWHYISHENDTTHETQCDTHNNHTYIMCACVCMCVCIQRKRKV